MINAGTHYANETKIDVTGNTLKMIKYFSYC
jgi:hypothetical protein